ncbi:hypothetical protein O181_113680 [Austropuccinia psidii MF-1]|uniref:Uncharacterized protein n=1 Tax=Austropuccinia psidii MF-1 TaxID=1389203 RepID=A0A9Q3PUS1_9BASI|nr:hypothetical protein [Austropuccinia psidii MF-1]
MGRLGAFWPNSNETKRGKGGSPPAPKARLVENHKWAHLSQFWSQSQQSQRMAKNHIVATFNPWPRETTRVHQLRPRKVSPKFRGRPLRTKGSRCGAYMV